MTAPINRCHQSTEGLCAEFQAPTDPNQYGDVCARCGHWEVCHAVNGEGCWSLLLREAEELSDATYPNGTRIRWEHFIGQLELYTDWNFGAQSDSLDIRRLQRHIREYRSLS